MSLGPSISRAPSPLNFSSRPSPSSRPPPVTWKVPPQIQADAQPRLRGRPSLPDMRTSVASTERNSVDDQDIHSGTLERSMSQIQRGRVSPFPSKPVGGVPRPAERRFGRVDSRMGRKGAENRHGPAPGMGKRVVFDFEVKVDEASDVDREEKRDAYGDDDEDEAGLAYDRSSYADGTYSARRSNHESINTTSTHTSTSTSTSSTSAASSSTKVTSSSSSSSSHEYHQFSSMKYHDTPIHQGDGVEEDFDDDASVYTAGRKTMYFEDDLDEFGIDEVNVESALERLLISHGGQRKSLRPDSEFIDDDDADDEDTFDARKSIRMSHYEEEGRRGVVMDGALSGEVRERFIKRVREWKDVNEQESERRGGMSFEETQEVNKRLAGATMRGGVGYRGGVSPIPPVPALPGASTGMARGIGRGVGRGGRF
ncbi:hypothetical protein ONZ45_g14408 [Pleurotus djamor]|nr:hypothetical protein ONZ45_g14408 [Pleurotus djamor]